MPIDDMSWFRVASLALEVMIVVVAIIWAVGRIRTATCVLNETVRGLRDTVAQLRDAVEVISERLIETRERVAKLEAKP